MILSGSVIGGSSVTWDSAVSGVALLTSAAAPPSAPPAIAVRRVGNRSPSRRPKSTTPSPTIAPYELRPDTAKLMSFIMCPPVDEIVALEHGNDGDASLGERSAGFNRQTRICYRRNEIRPPTASLVIPSRAVESVGATTCRNRRSTR